MQNEKISKSLTYASTEPDVKTLCHAYTSTNNELSAYFDLCRDSYDDRRNWWAGKSRDLRKHGADAFPWDGASDLESFVIEERMTRLTSLFISALNRSNIKAFPVEGTDIPRAKVVSNFLKWMVTSGYIPRFKRESELGANYLLEKGILITYCGWIKEDRTFNQALSLEEIAQADPELAQVIIDGDSDEQIVKMLQNFLNGVSEKDAIKAVQDLRETGQAQLPTIKRQVNAPEVKTLSPDGDFMFPPYVTDPQRAPYCFWRTYYTAQELQNKVITDGWDERWVDHVIDKFSGVNINTIEREQEGRRSISLTDNAYQADELIEVIYGYQRLIAENGSEGIYCTIFHEDFSGNEHVQGYGKFELLNGYEDYPVIVTRLSEDSKRLYDTMTVPDILRGLQNQIKVERDSRIDNNSMATLPPVKHPIGQAPTDWGPGRFVPERRRGDVYYADGPAYNAGSMEMEQTLQQQADRLVGLDEESPISGVRRQFLVDKFLQHNAEVLALCYKNFQRFGPDSIFFNVTGVADPQKFNKGNPEESFDVTINYDSLNNDPESQEAKLQQLTQLLSLDRNGRINVDALLGVMAESISPVLADSILQPVEEAQEKVLKDITDDLSKIHAGIEVPARPNGAQAALQLIQQYAQQEDIAQELQENKAFAERLQKYAQQYQFAIQQTQNAEIGRIGTAPATVGQSKTQYMAQ